MERGISRRNFLKGAVAGAGALAATSLLGACATENEAVECPSVDTTTTTATTASDVPEWLGAEPEISADKISETVETEVVVIGSGSAGWPAALSAAEEGAKVILVERNASLFKPKDDIGAYNSKLQQETEKNYPYLAIDRVALLKDAVRYAGGYIDSQLVNLWLDRSGELVDWYTEILERNGDFKMWHEGGIGHVDSGARDKAYATGHSPEALGEKTTSDVLKEYGDELGVEYRLETEFIKLVKTGDRVTGVICSDADGKYIQINASNGVILCTGGYSANKAMMSALQPEAVKISGKDITVGSSDNGSGIKAALWAGAQMDMVHGNVSFNRTCVLPTGKGGDSARWYWFGEQPFMKVNTRGVRFCNESGPYDFMLHSMSMQPDNCYIQVFDANVKEQTKQLDMVGCCRLFPFDNGAPSNMPFDYVWDNMCAKLIEDGYIVKADTIEELAEAFNLPVDAFKAQVERYNHYAETGVDEEFGKVSYRLTPINTPPYYGVKVCAWLLATQDGIRINTDMHAIDENNEAIPGLYVCGDTSGGFMGKSYFNLVTGMACGRSMTFGRLAGQNAAHNI